ncbi:MAG: LysM peptidoglycan-binding domain-containing protein [Peptococcaceae bacterium]|nr:LysM peptidoglycan-binding domain-containing protein [Peptococcaceae bacterium]
MKHYKRWNPRNLLVLLSVLMLTAVVINIFSVVTPTEAAGNKVCRSIIVQNGDNLWRLAQKYKPDQDPRLVIASIEKINRLSDETILPGEVLQIPLN